MELTRFIVERRNDALVVGDYGSYRRSLTRRILTLRRKLGRTTTKGRKYTAKAPITAEDIASNEEYIHLQLLIAERGWAYAMFMKSLRSDDTDQALTGSKRTHILSRLEKARKSAATLCEALSQSASGVSEQLLLEAQAYHAQLSGAFYFEARKWQKCLEAYSIVQLVYNSLTKNNKQSEVFQELLTNTIEPSIRYAAYQQKLSRTLPIPQIVSKYANKSDPTIKTLLKVHPDALDDEVKTKGDAAEDRVLPKSITWRTRQVPLEHAKISEALANVHDAEAKLAKALSSFKLTLKEKAAAYDDVLVPSQDAVDAAKAAIDELVAEGVPSADKRLQALQITRTALNYDLISWRIGRNRVLCGDQDGATIVSSSKKGNSGTTGAKSAKLRERCVLYDSILQSLDSINDLPGVAADQALGKELSRQRSYFSTLRSISIARSHALLGNDKNALALFANAAQSADSVTASSTITQQKDKPLGLHVSQDQAEFIKQYTKGLVTQHHALAEIHSLQQEEIKVERSRQYGMVPFIEHLDEYPTSGVDLTKLVDYPPKLQAIPVKPIFYDVAWNAIDYPGREQQSSATRLAEQAKVNQAEEAKPQKRGWFGFGR